MLDNHKHDHAVRDFDGVIEIRSNPVPRYFAILFYGLLIWGVLFIAYFLLSGWSSEAHFAQKMSDHLEHTAAQPSTAAVAVGDEHERLAEASRLYAQHCAVCHGAQGEGGIGPALNEADYIYGRDLAAVTDSIAQGRPNGMPAYGTQFSPAQIEALAEFLIAL